MSIISGYSGTIKVGELVFEVKDFEMEAEPVTDDMMDATRRAWEATREFIKRNPTRNPVDQSKIVDSTLAQPIMDTTRLLEGK
jgi:hypothetical protein